METMGSAMVDALVARAGILLEPEERERVVVASRILNEAFRRIRSVEDPTLESATPFVHPEA